MTRALLLVLLVAAIATGVILFASNSDRRFDPGAPDSGENTQVGSGHGDTQEVDGGNPATKEAREMVEGRAGTTSESSGAGGTGTVKLRGRLRTDGRPVAAAVVFQVEPAGLDSVVRRGLRSAKMDPALETRSDAEGRFVFEVPRGKSGRLRLAEKDLVLARGGADTSVPVAMGAEGTDLGDVEVVAAARLSGRVVAGGRGIPGVEVSIDRDQLGLGLFGNRGVKTDAEGRFAFPAGMVPREVHLTTRSPEYLPASRTLTLKAGEHKSDYLITLEEGGAITGMVHDDRGQPVAGAKVTAARARKLGEGIEVRGFSPGESTTTDAGGQFRLAGLAEDAVQIRADKSGYRPGLVNGAKVGQTKLLVTMARHGKIEGVLVDEKGQPIPGSRVSASAQDESANGLGGSRGDSAETDAEGKFVLASIAPGGNRVRAEGPTHLDATTSVQVHPGETATGVRLVARRGSTLTVTVLDDAGNPVAGAMVSASSVADQGQVFHRGPGGSSRSVRREVRRESRGGRTTTRFLGGAEELGTAKTGADGIAVLRGLPSGSATVRAEHADLALVAPTRAEIPDGGQAEAKLRMGRGGFAEVQIVDSQGQPLAEKAMVLTGPMVGGEDESPRKTHRSGSGGSVRIGPLKPGAYRAALVQDARMSNLGGSMTFAIPGEETDLAGTAVEFTVKADKPTEVRLVMPVLTTVRGTVRDAEGLVADAEVELVGEGQVRMPMMGRHKTRTGPQGEFELAGLSAGTYTLSYNRRGAVLPAEKEVVFVKNQPTSVHDLTLPGGVLELRVQDGVGGFGVDEAKLTLTRYTPPQPGGSRTPARPRQMMMVSLRVDGSGAGSGPTSIKMSSGGDGAETDAKGHAVLKDIPAGKYTLTIKHGDYATHTQVVDVGEGQHKDLGVVKVHAGCTVRGTVKFVAPGELNFATVELRDGNGFRETTMSRGGSFQFTGLKAGDYQIRAQKIGAAAWGPEQKVKAEPNAVGRVTLELASEK